jgi:iron complex outermembrane receptor protein
MKSLFGFSRVVFLLVCALALALGNSPLLNAQSESTATLSGSVLDARGSAIPNAPVTVKSETGSLTRKTTSGSDGRFSISGLPQGSYTVEVTFNGFEPYNHKGVKISASGSNELPVTLTVASISEEITVSADDSISVASQLAPVKALLDEGSARSEITNTYIREFTSPVSDFTEIVNIVPGTFSVNPNGVGLGASNTYFRGFADGEYTISYDGIPFEDTNDPTHHSWAFFPAPTIGGVDFDRSPGTASDIGPTNFGGSIHLLSPQLPTEQGFKISESYGSFNTQLIDGSYDSGLFAGKKANLLFEANHLTSDGYETENFQVRTAGELKLNYKFSDKTVLTLLSSVLILDNNTPDANAPTRAQVAQYGRNYLLDSTQYLADGVTLDPLYYKYYFYHVPTDFEYIGLTSDLGHGWKIDEKPYTFTYSNHQHYNNSETTVSAKSAVDKLNAYNRIGDTLTVSQTSKYGVFRAGIWYEHSNTNRAQYKSNPTDWVDVPGVSGVRVHERFWTNSVQPFAEYQYVGIKRLTVTAGIKDAYYNMNLKQYADGGHDIGGLNGAPYVSHDAPYNSWLPALELNYRVKSNASVYVQFAKGSVIPPSAVYDVTGANVTSSGLPNPTETSTYQGGTVIKLNRVSFDADAYYSRFQNTYSSFTPSSGPNAGVSFDYLGPDSSTKGFEAEANVLLTKGLSFFLNGTVGKAAYVPAPRNPLNGAPATREVWVANTPNTTLSEGATYQNKNWDLGFFNKRVGDMWNDNVDLYGNPLHQAVPIAAFSVANVFANYEVKNNSLFDHSKIKFSVNNLFNDKNIVGVTPGNPGTALDPYTIDPSDTITLLPVRSYMVSFQFGFTPREK